MAVIIEAGFVPAVLFFAASVSLVVAGIVNLFQRA
jgi:hypothetical protein